MSWVQFTITLVPTITKMRVNETVFIKNVSQFLSVVFCSRGKEPVSNNLICLLYDWRDEPLNLGVKIRLMKSIWLSCCLLKIITSVNRYHTSTGDQTFERTPVHRASIFLVWKRIRANFTLDYGLDVFRLRVTLFVTVEVTVA